jgi:DNA-directed RNA polymerase subunit RPC12/RpoP
MLSELDCSLNDFIICPYCGYENHDSFEYADIRDTIDYTCPNCGKDCLLDAPDISIKYTTHPKEEP